MTYVADQTGAELRAHMKMLKAIKGFNDPLSDRLFAEIQILDTEVRRLTGCLERANSLAEQFERKFYLLQIEEQEKTDRFVRQLDEAIDLAETAEQMAKASADYAMIDNYLRCNLNSDADYAEYSAALDRLYTRHQPAAQWVGLTDEERNTIARHHAYVDNIILATEAKLKSKNEHS